MNASDFSSQLETLRVFRRYVERNGYSPTYHELSLQRGMSLMAVRRHVRDLVGRGHLRFGTYRTWRNIKLPESA